MRKRKRSLLRRDSLSGKHYDFIGIMISLEAIGIGGVPVFSRGQISHRPSRRRGRPRVEIWRLCAVGREADGTAWGGLAVIDGEGIFLDNMRRPRGIIDCSAKDKQEAT